MPVPPLEFGEIGTDQWMEFMAWSHGGAMKERLQSYTGWLPKWIKDQLCALGCGDCLLEYCNDCGMTQPLSWWCRDSALWLEVNNGMHAGALCPQCFDRRASKLGKYVRWYPEAVLFDAPAAERSGETR